MGNLYFAGRDFPIDLDLGGNLLDAVMSAKLPIATACGGMGACGQCRCTVTAGAEHLSPSNDKELKLLGEARLAQGERLACQTRLIDEGDVRLRLPQLDDIARRRQEKWTRQLRERRAQQKERKQRSRPGDHSRSRS